MTTIHSALQAVKSPPQAEGQEQRGEELIPTRASLLSRLRNQQDESRWQSSWREFFEIYWRLVYGVARKAGLTDAESQDVVQETMSSVARHIPGFKYDPERGSFKSWLLQMTRWRITDQLRKRLPSSGQRGTTSTDPVEKLPDTGGKTLDQVWEEEWEANLYQAALAKVRLDLDPAKYQIWDFCTKKGWPPEKVAARFRASVEQVYLIKHRVNEKIKAEVRRLETETT